MGNIVVASSWLVAGGLALWALVEFYPPDIVRASYERINVTPAIRLISAAAKAVAAALLPFPAYRILGATLGVMIASTSMVWLMLELRLKTASISLGLMITLTMIAAYSV
jgi:hypothetical protein